MANWKHLGELAGVTAGFISMGIFVESIRQEVKKAERPLTELQKAKKEFVEAWDKMLAIPKAEAEFNEMLKEAAELTERQKQFRERFGKFLQ